MSKSNKKKDRLDTIISQKFPNLTLKEIHAQILTGRFIINNQKETKPGSLIQKDAHIKHLPAKRNYVSRGGEKLLEATKKFNLNFKDAFVLDIGISTGGFTDFVRQNGAKWVVGIDVGYGQVAMKLQQDPQVIILERTNARTLNKEQLQSKIKKINPEAPSINNCTHLVMDVSFISVTQLLPILKNWIQKTTLLTILIKPQFEATQTEIPTGGVIKDHSLRESILKRVKNKIESQGWDCLNETPSPIKGSKGNIEHFFLIRSKN